jgi:outer membrane protein TolC
MEVYRQIQMTAKKFIFCRALFLALLLAVVPALTCAQEPVDTFSLKQTIETAIKVNLELKSSQQETDAAMAGKNAKRADFLPTLSSSYVYDRLDDESTYGGLVTAPKEQYTFVTSFSQPVFTGFSVIRQYDIAKLGLELAKVSESLQRQDIVLQAKNVYFQLLRSQKLYNIAQETVVQIRSQEEVANNFYQVGMSPLNELLQAQVELANAKQGLIVAKNNLESAEADFNTLLRRPVNAPVTIEDILDYHPFRETLDYCLFTAEKNRLEIQIADLDLQIAQKELQLAKKDYFPAVDLKGNYFKRGTEWDVDGGEGIYDPDGWEITATATWKFWEWGRTSYGVKEKLSRVSQAELRKEKRLDNIYLEVKNAYLRMQEAEKAIVAVEKAIEQAKENFRINKERYKEQVATSTDVLDAQTLLSRTMTNYYNALYAFKLAKAGLYRAMGQEIME